MSSPSRHGKYYWCIKSNLSKNGEIYVHADKLNVNANGDLVCIGKNNLILLSIASGSWDAFFAASIIDGSAVAVWGGEVIARHDMP